MAEKTRYVQVGCGGRSGMYTKAICQKYPETCEIVAICDVDISGADESAPGELRAEGTYITLMPHFAEPEEFEAVKVRTAEGGHGGGDDPLLADIFDPDAPADPLGRKADHVDGTYSILVGVAAYHSIDTGKAIKIADLIGDAPIAE